MPKVRPNRTFYQFQIATDKILDGKIPEILSGDKESNKKTYIKYKYIHLFAKYLQRFLVVDFCIPVFYALNMLYLFRLQFLWWHLFSLQFLARCSPCYLATPPSNGEPTKQSQVQL